MSLQEMGLFYSVSKKKIRFSNIIYQEYNIDEKKKLKTTIQQLLNDVLSNDNYLFSKDFYMVLKSSNIRNIPFHKLKNKLIFLIK